MEFMALMIVCIVGSLVDKSRFYLWLALANIFTAISLYLTAQFWVLGFLSFFIVLLIWLHFHKKTIDISKS